VLGLVVSLPWRQAAVLSSHPPRPGALVTVPVCSLQVGLVRTWAYVGQAGNTQSLHLTPVPVDRSGGGGPAIQLSCPAHAWPWRFSPRTPCPTVVPFNQPKENMCHAALQHTLAPGVLQFM
jgi:hypothetical protein